MKQYNVETSNIETSNTQATSTETTHTEISDTEISDTEISNTETTNSNTHNDTSDNLRGLVFLFPLFIILIAFVIIPIVNTVSRSFTDFNFMTKGKFIYFDNYKAILNDKVAIIAIKNTIIFCFFSTVISFSISMLFVWLSSHLHKHLKSILCVLFILVSLTYVVPVGLLQLAQSREFNSFFHMNESTILFNPTFLRFVSIMLPVVIGLSPLYVIFTVGLKHNKIKKFLHIGVTLQIVISFLCYEPVKMITGFPSVNYVAHNLQAHIYDHLFFRLNGGYGSALMVVMACILFLFIISFNVIILMITYLAKYKARNSLTYSRENNYYNNHVKSFVAIIMLFSFIVLLIYPFLQTIFNSVKPLHELYQYPQKLLARDITLNNYKSLSEITPYGLPIHTFIYNSCIDFGISTVAMFFVLIISNTGFLKLNRRLRKNLRKGILFTSVLSPILLSYITINKLTSTFDRIFPITVHSVTFGFSLYIGYILYDKYKRNTVVRDRLHTRKAKKSYILGVFVISLLASIPVWFTQPRFYVSENQMSLYQLLVRSVNSSFSINEIGETSSLYVLTMMIPFIIIIIGIPILLNWLEDSTTID